MTTFEISPNFVVKSEFADLVKLASDHEVQHHELHPRVGKIVRKVRTPEGAKIYGQPIGTIITKDMMNPKVKHLGHLGEPLKSGSRIQHTTDSGKSYYYTKQNNGQFKNEKTGTVASTDALKSSIAKGQLTHHHVAGEDVGKEAPEGSTKTVKKVVEPKAPPAVLNAQPVVKGPLVTKMAKAPEGTSVTVKTGDKKATFTKGANQQWTRAGSTNTYYPADFSKYETDGQLSFDEKKDITDDKKTPSSLTDKDKLLDFEAAEKGKLKSADEKKDESKHKNTTYDQYSKDVQAQKIAHGANPISAKNVGVGQRKIGAGGQHYDVVVSNKPLGKIVGVPAKDQKRRIVFRRPNGEEYSIDFKQYTTLNLYAAEKGDEAAKGGSIDESGNVFDSKEMGGHGGEWTPEQKASIQAVVDKLNADFVAPLKKVKIDPDRLSAGKSNDTIYLPKAWADKEFMTAREKEFKGLIINPTLEGTITHEYGHILDGYLQKHNPEAYQSLNDYLSEEVPFDPDDPNGKKVPRMKNGLSAPSAYGSENRYEFVAEAFADWRKNGDYASEPGQWIGKLFDKEMGKNTDNKTSLPSEIPVEVPDITAPKDDHLTEQQLDAAPVGAVVSLIGDTNFSYEKTPDGDWKPTFGTSTKSYPSSSFVKNNYEFNENPKDETYLGQAKKLYGDKLITSKKQLDGLAEGTVITAFLGGDTSYEKKDGSWKLVGGNTKADPDSLVNGTYKWHVAQEGSKAVITAETLDDAKKPDPETPWKKTFSSTADLDNLPSGTTIHRDNTDGGNNYTMKKNKNGQWASPDGTNYDSDAFSASLTDWYLDTSKDHPKPDKIQNDDLDGLPPGSLIKHISDGYQFRKKEDGEWYYADETGNISPGEIGYDSQWIKNDNDSGDGFTVVEKGRDKPAQHPVAEVIAPETASGVTSQKQTLKVGNKEFKIPFDSTVYTDEHPGEFLVKDNNGDWTYYGEDNGTVNVSNLSATGYWNNKVLAGDLKPYGESEPDVTPVQPQLPLAPDHKKDLQFSVGNSNFTAPEGSEVFGFPGDPQIKYVKSPDGEWKAHFADGTSQTKSYNEMQILEKSVANGNLVSDTTASTEGPLHPSGLKPGRYSKGPVSKVYMQVNSDGTAVYVDKNGAAKKLGTKGVLGHYNGGLQYHQEPKPGESISVPKGSISSTEQSFDLSGKAITVPSGSKVYVAKEDNPYAIVKTPDGKWNFVSPSGIMKPDPENNWDSEVQDEVTFNQINDLNAVESKPSKLISFDSNGKTFTVPDGSKVYQNPYAPSLKYVQKPDGTWVKVTDGELKDDIDMSSLVASGSLVPSEIKEVSDEKKISPTKKISKTTDALDGVYPFSGPPDIQHYTKTNVLKATIKKMAEDSGFGTTAGQYRTQMTDEQKKEWIKAWYNGDFDKAYNVELQAALKVAPGTKLTSYSEVVDSPTGTKLVYSPTGSSNVTIIEKQQDGNWKNSLTEKVMPKLSDESIVQGVLDKGEVQYFDSIKHKASEKHPGSPDNPTNANGFQKIKFGAAVAGEIPAGEPVSSPNITDYSMDNLKTIGAYQYDPGTVDAYLLAAGMKNSHGLYKQEKNNWVQAHVNGDKAKTDELSLKAKANLDKGNLHSEILTPTLPSVTAGESVGQFSDNKDFNVGASHANNLDESQVNLYMDALFQPKQASVVKKQPLDVKRAIAQLHWLSAQPSVKGAYRSPDEAKAEYEALHNKIITQIGNKPTDYNGQFTDFALNGLHFDEHKVWKKADVQSVYDDSNSAKYDIVDDQGNVLFFKPAKVEWRAEVADTSNKIGKFFGFKTPASQLLTVDGVFGQAQAKVPSTGSIGSMKPEELTAKQFNAVMEEHLLDWALDNDDGHSKQFLIGTDNSIIGIDKDRSFFAKFKANKLELGKLSAWNEHAQEKVYYEAMYRSIVDGKIPADQVQAAYKSVMARARSMENKPDDQYTALVNSALKNNPYLDSHQKEEVIKDALRVKNSLVKDFDKFWDGIFKDSGIEKPEITSTKFDGNPDVHTGFTPEYMEAMQNGRKFGHATMFASGELEDGHVVVREALHINGGKSILGNAMLLSGGDEKFVKWIQDNYSGVNAPDKKTSETLEGQSQYDDTILNGLKTIAGHSTDGKYNEAKIEKMEHLLADLADDIENKKFDNLYGGDQEKIAAHYQMAQQYLDVIAQAMDAKENGKKPDHFAPYQYTPKDLSPTKLKSNFKVTMRNASMYQLDLDKENGTLTDSDKLTNHGQTGSEYVVDLGDGLTVAYRPWDTTPNISQKGKLTFHKSDYQGDSTYGDRVMDFLRDEVGIQADEASDESMESQYWHTYYAAMTTRSDFNSGKQLKVKQAVIENDPRKISSKSEELARWREIFSQYGGQDKVDKFLDHKGFRPSFDKVTIQDADNGHGAPHWHRFDVDLDEFRMNQQFVARAPDFSSGVSSDSDDSVLRDLLTGAAIPVEERALVLGRWISGTSGDSDSSHGSGSYAMGRQNQESGAVYGLYFDPEITARLHTYAFSSDNYGKVNLKSSEAPFDINSMTDFSGTGNEVIVKHDMSMLSSLRLAVFSQESNRQKAIALLNQHGIEELNGVPLDEIFVLEKNHKQGLKDAHARLNAQITGDPNYVPAKRGFSVGQKISDPESLDSLPIGATIDSGIKGIDSLTLTKTANTVWTDASGSEFKNSDFNFNGSLSGYVVSGLPDLNSGKTYDINSENGLKSMPVGSVITNKHGGTETFTKESNGNWFKSSNNKEYNDYSLSNLVDSDVYEYKVPEQSGELGSSSYSGPTIGQKINGKEDLDALPQGSKINLIYDGIESETYTKTGDTNWISMSDEGFHDSSDFNFSGISSKFVVSSVPESSSSVAPYMGALTGDVPSQLDQMAAGSVVQVEAPPGNDWSGIYTKKSNGLWSDGANPDFSGFASSKISASNVGAGPYKVTTVSEPGKPLVVPKGVLPQSSIKATLASLPVGSQITLGSKEYGTFYDVYQKIDGNQWANKLGSGNLSGSFDAFDFYTDPDYQVSVKKIEGQEKVWETGEQVNNVDDLKDVPVGTVLLDTEDGNNYKKDLDGNWTDTEGDSYENGEFDLSTGTFKIVGLPEGTTSSSSSLPKLEKDEDLKSLPIGTIIEPSGGGLQYTLKDDGFWHSQYGTSSTSSFASNLSAWKVKSIPTSNVEPPQFDESSGLKYASPDDLNQLPVGSMLTMKNSVASYTKQPDGQWKNANSGNLYPISAFDAGTTKLSSLYDLKVPLFKTPPYDTAAAIDKLPTGSVLTDKKIGTQWTKNPDGKWVTVHNNGQESAGFKGNAFVAGSEGPPSHYFDLTVPDPDLGGFDQHFSSTDIKPGESVGSVPALDSSPAGTTIKRTYENGSYSIWIKGANGSWHVNKYVDAEGVDKPNLDGFDDLTSKDFDKVISGFLKGKLQWEPEKLADWEADLLNGGGF